MAKVPLSPLGRPLDAFLDDATYRKNRADQDGREETLVATADLQLRPQFEPR